MAHVSLEDLPKKIQYIAIDSHYVDGTNNVFSVNFDLESNMFIEQMDKVIGFKLVDFYITQVGEANPNSDNRPSDIAKFVDIKCAEIPKRGQILSEAHGMLLARVPLERHYSHSSHTILRDKQWRAFNRKTNYFNPISIKKLNFEIYEEQGDDDYVLLQPDATWHMIFEVTTIDVKEKPVNRELQILEALHTLIGKIETLNENVRKLPEKEEDKPKRKKISFNYILLALALIAGGYVYFINRRGAPPVGVPMGVPMGVPS